MMQKRVTHSTGLVHWRVADMTMRTTENIGDMRGHFLNVLIPGKSTQEQHAPSAWMSKNRLLPSFHFKKWWPYSGWITICSVLSLNSHKSWIVQESRRGKKQIEIYLQVWDVSICTAMKALSVLQRSDANIRQLSLCLFFSRKFEQDREGEKKKKKRGGCQRRGLLIVRTTSSRFCCCGAWIAFQYQGIWLSRLCFFTSSNHLSWRQLVTSGLEDSRMIQTGGCSDGLCLEFSFIYFLADMWRNTNTNGALCVTLITQSAQ